MDAAAGHGSHVTISDEDTVATYRPEEAVAVGAVSETRRRVELIGREARESKKRKGKGKGRGAPPAGPTAGEIAARKANFVPWYVKLREKKKALAKKKPR